MKRGLFWLVVVGLVLYNRPTFAQESATLTVQGRIIQGTADGLPLPDNLPIELQVISVQEVRPIHTRTVLTQADGSFIFENVPRVQGQDFYLLYATYAGVQQYTPPLNANQVNFVSFPLYETTNQFNGVEIVGGNMQINQFTRVEGSGVNLEVIMELQVISRGDRILYNRQTTPPTSFSFGLPVGVYGVAEVTPDSNTAQTLHIEQGDISMVYDTLPLVPLWPRPRTLRVTYLLPYPKEAIIDQLFSVPVRNLEVWVPRDTVYLTGDAFSLTDEERTVAPGIPPYRVYQQNAPLAAGENLIFMLSGEPTVTLPPSREQILRDSANTGSRALIFGLGMAGILFLVGGFWWVRRRRQVILDLPDSPQAKS